MATFVWPPEVQWPPPAHILLNYDVVAPGGAGLSLHRAGEMEERMTQPFLALITPLSSGGQPDQGLPGRPPGIWGGAPPYPDQGLPPSGVGVWPSPGHPSHPIVLPPGSISGTPDHPIYTPPMPPGHPSHPIVLPPNSVGGTPEHPIYYPPVSGSPPGIWGGPPAYPSHPIAPGGRPPGIWGGPPAYPDQGLPVPPEAIQPPLPDVPPEYADKMVVAVKKPDQPWEVTAYDVYPDQGLPPTSEPKPPAA
jgi:hypothetical protein